VSRRCKDWLDSYIQYASHGEAPPHVHFWCGVSALAACLQRRVYFDQSPHFVWYPNFYIILVAPPAVIAKSSTANLAMNLLAGLPGVHFGPAAISWQKLISKFNDVKQDFIDPKKRTQEQMRALTIVSSELGTFLLPNDKEILNALIKLYDCEDYDRSTHAHGDEKVRKTWLNFIGCTTPTWISENLPHYMVGGGLVSRILWVYADKKEKYVPYPAFVQASEEQDALRKDLIHDLTEILDLTGEYSMTTAAKEWGEDWYHRHFKEDMARLDDSDFKGYIQRKQGHMHKLAMVLSASRGDSLIITKEDLVRAEKEITKLEFQTKHIFKQMGKSQTANQSDKLVDYIDCHGTVSIADAYEHVRGHFPKLSDFEGVLKGLLRSGVLLAVITSKGTSGLKVGRPPASEGDSSTHPQT